MNIPCPFLKFQNKDKISHKNLDGWNIWERKESLRSTKKTKKRERLILMVFLRGVASPDPHIVKCRVRILYW